VYPAGLSTSLPAEVQLQFLRSIEGLEAVEVERYGYAVEYDYAPPTQLKPTLETRAVAGLFFAGQLNGTSGYEEAAFQGLLAGINAGLQVQGRAALVLGRHEAHGAVLLDELVSRGVDEPFRMFTARSEHRLTLREGNARYRLGPHGHRVGLVSQALADDTEARRAAIAQERERLAREGLVARLKRPEVSYAGLAAEDPLRPTLPEDVRDEVETGVKYEGYVAIAQATAARRATAQDDWGIPEGFDFAQVRGLSTEARERLARARPLTLGQARRLPGVTQVTVALVAVALRRARA
jgi:tRNA uridine 5-carboxymethylaminomethyl modification enzyme